MAIKSGEWLGAWQRNLSNGKTKRRKLQYYAKKSVKKEEERAQRQLSSQIVDLFCKMR